MDSFPWYKLPMRVYGFFMQVLTRNQSREEPPEGALLVIRLAA